jgi:hypothetical protein
MSYSEKKSMLKKKKKVGEHLEKKGGIIGLSKFIWYLFTQRYSWYTAKVGIEHQSVNNEQAGKMKGQALVYILSLFLRFLYWIGELTLTVC